MEILYVDGYWIIHEWKIKSGLWCLFDAVVQKGKPTNALLILLYEWKLLN